MTTKRPTANEIRRRYIDFFVKNYAHKEIASSSVIPENDPTVLFTTAGMHPLVPFLMGEPHPQGTRLVNSQKCVRTDDIDEVGDATHCTFFEMLGNWSLGDYFKELAIEMSFKLMTTPWEEGGLGLPVERLSVSCFEGDKDAPKDEESKNIWLSQKTKEGHGIPENRIYFLPKKKNWWGPAGQTGPCGPDTEMFYDVCYELPGYKENSTLHKEGGRVSQPHCDVACDCGRYVEIWNDVFMQYNKKGEGVFEPLAQQNVDTGMGLERVTAILQGKESPFETELFWSAVRVILEKASRESSDGKIPEDIAVSVRIIADHLRAATFILGDKMGVSPSNVDQGYIVRRLIRRAVRHGKQIGIQGHFTPLIAAEYIKIYGDVWTELVTNGAFIMDELQREEELFSRTLEHGLKEFDKLIENKKSDTSLGQISGEEAFHLFETYGFPLEMIEEELAKKGHTVSHDEFRKAFGLAFKKHQELSRAGATQKFSGGLADDSEQCKMHHTATHLVHQALRDVLGTHVYQRGSNITKERLRFDFAQDDKMTPEQIKKVEEIVNTQIQKDMPIHFEILDVTEAKSRGAIGIFEDKYASLGNKVKVYFMGDYSKEVCGGPHVEHTGVLKHFKILKEEACSRGVRRIKAIVEGIKDVI
ncbi:alanine--tRNA ligase [Candidatus Gracilibacteria bacterium]|nr:alanine--tRNA ligase [Candidatus Gracilibacteria bacterium]